MGGGRGGCTVVGKGEIKISVEQAGTVIHRQGYRDRWCLFLRFLPPLLIQDQGGWGGGGPGSARDEPLVVFLALRQFFDIRYTNTLGR